MQPVFVHEGNESPTIPKTVDASEAGQLPGVNGLSIAAVVCCTGGNFEDEQPVGRVIKLMHCPGGSSESARLSLIMVGRHGDALDLELWVDGLTVFEATNFWLNDSAEHRYLLTYDKKGTVQSFRDGKSIKKVTGKPPLTKCVREKLILGDGTRTMAGTTTTNRFVKYIADVQVWNNVVTWEDAYRLSKRKRADHSTEVASKARLIWESRLFTDSTILCDGEEIKVHRAILAASSPVLATMFGTDFMEGRECSLSIDNTSSATMHAFLQHVYTGSLPEQTDFFELVRLADQYQVSGLVSVCTLSLLGNASHDSMLDTLRVLKPLRHHEVVANAWKELLEQVQADSILFQTIMEGI